MTDKDGLANVQVFVAFVSFFWMAVQCCHGVAVADETEKLLLAMPWFACDLAMHRASSHGTHRVVTHSQKTRFSAHRTGCCWPNSSLAVKKVSKDGVQDQAPTWDNGCVFCFPNNVWKTFCSGQDNTSYHCNKVIQKWTTFHATGTPILHAEASFISAERGLRRGVSSRTSLKCCIHFSFILKLAFFICEQLKRPAAFGAVHFDVASVHNSFKAHLGTNVCFDLFKERCHWHRPQCVQCEEDELWNKKTNDKSRSNQCHCEGF